MKVASISQPKNQLSALIAAVKQSETVLTMDRDRPVARVEPVGNSDWDDSEGRLARLERSGVLKRAKGPPALDILDERRSTPKEGVSVLAALLEEREAGR
jgi:antitoxin (DNA-binding transcriptional repressor) of toxin-antitoxin stability system